MYFGNGEDTTRSDRLIFDKDSVLFQLIKLDRQQNDTIRLQILEHYGEVKESKSCYEKEQTKQTAPFIDTFYYSEQNLDLIDHGQEPTLQQHFIQLQNIDTLTDILQRIKKSRQHLSSKSNKSRKRRHFVNGQSTSHLIVHVYKPDEPTPYASIVDMASPKPLIKDTTNMASPKPPQEWRDVFFEKGEYFDLSNLIKKVDKALEYIANGTNFKSAKEDLKSERIKHLYKNDGVFQDMIHGGNTDGNEDPYDTADEGDGTGFDPGEDSDAYSDDGNGTEPGTAVGETGTPSNGVATNVSGFGKLPTPAERLEEERLEKEVAEYSDSDSDSLDGDTAEKEENETGKKNAPAVGQTLESSEVEVVIEKIKKHEEVETIEQLIARLANADITNEDRPATRELLLSKLAEIQTKNTVELGKMEAEAGKQSEEIKKLEMDIEQLQKQVVRTNTGAEAARETIVHKTKELKQLQEEKTFREGVITKLEARISYMDELMLIAEEHLSMTRDKLGEAEGVIVDYKKNLDAANGKSIALRQELERLRGNNDGKLAFENTERFKAFDELLREIKIDDIEERTIKGGAFKNNGDDLWLFDQDKDHALFRNDAKNFQLIQIYLLKKTIDNFLLKPKIPVDVYNTIFRAHLYNKLIKKVNEVLQSLDIKFATIPLKFPTIPGFVSEDLTRIGDDPIDKLKNSRAFKEWKKPAPLKFNDEDNKVITRLNNRFIASGNALVTYKNMRDKHMDKVFCPIFHSSKYISNTYKTVGKFIRFVNGTADSMNIFDNTKQKDGDEIDKKMLLDLKLDNSYDYITKGSVVFVKFDGGLALTHFLKNGEQNGAGNIDFALSPRSIERIQNVSYYNIVKTIRWRYYLHQKKNDESVETTIFIDYLFTLIACIFILASGNDKLAYGTFADQVLSMVMYYEFNNDPTALLLPYYLPFT